MSWRLIKTTSQWASGCLKSLATRMCVQHASKEQWKCKSSILLTLYEGPVDSTHKGPVRQQAFPCHKVIMWKDDQVDRYYRKNNYIWNHFISQIFQHIKSLLSDLDKFTPRFCPGYQWFRFTFSESNDAIQNDRRCLKMLSCNWNILGEPSQCNSLHRQVISTYCIDYSG